MDAQAPAVAPPAPTSLLDRYATALEAEGFTIDWFGTTDLIFLSATWVPEPRVYYFLDLNLEQGAVCVRLMRKQPGQWHVMMLNLTRVESPEEVHWLLERNVLLAQARAQVTAESENRGLPAATPAAGRGQRIRRVGADNP